MFCGNCGSKTTEGKQFCATCGHANGPTSISEFGAASLVLDRPETPTESPLDTQLGATDSIQVEPATARKNWLFQNKILIGIVVTFVGVLAVVLSMSLRTQAQDQLNATAANEPTASAMGCTDAWSLVKTVNRINVFDCSTAYGSGHQTLWRFDDAGALASFKETMRRGIRPSGHLVYTDKWAIISDSTESFQAAINAGGQDYGS
jgi:hypothetical protein